MPTLNDTELRKWILETEETMAILQGLAGEPKQLDSTVLEMMRTSASNILIALTHLQNLKQTHEGTDK